MSGQKGLSKFDISMALGLLLALCFANVSVFGRQCAAVRGDVVRLHILANSDSDEDQRIKLEVRDAILEELGEVFEQPGSQQAAKRLAESELENIRAIAVDVLQKEGLALPVNAQVCTMYFPTREYDAFTLPAGYYDAVRVTLGDGAGHNWWCVMYPPLCIPAAAVNAKGQDTGENLEPTGAKQAREEIEALNQQPLLRPKLAIVELFESWFGNE